MKKQEHNFLWMIVVMVLLQILTSKNSMADEKSDFLEQVRNGDFSLAESALKRLVPSKKSLNAFEGKYSFMDVLTTWDRLYTKWPELKELETRINRQEELSEDEYRILLQQSGQQIEGILSHEGATTNLQTLQAIYRGLYNLSIIKSKTKFKLPEQNPSGSEAQSKDRRDDEQTPWDESSDQYKPRNKPFDSEEEAGLGSNKILIETDAPLKSPLMGSEIFDEVESDRWSKSAVGRVNIYRDTRKKYRYKVYTYGQNNISLPIPSGFRPAVKAVSGQRDVAVVSEKNQGEFILTHNESNDGVVELDLIRQKMRRHSIDERDLVKKHLVPTGIDKGKWPVAILDVVELAKGHSSDPLEQVRFIGQYIKNNFQYYSKKLGTKALANADRIVAEARSQGFPDPIAFSMAKTVQCDGTAWILSALARDFLKVPVRMRTGRTAVKRGDVAVVRISDPRHAWIEVWVSGKGWTAVDATPAEAEAKHKKHKKHKNDKKKKQKSDKSKDRPIKDMNTLKDKKKQNKDNDKDKNGNDTSLSESPPLMDEIATDLAGASGIKKNLTLFNLYFAEELKRVAVHVGNPKKKLQEITSMITHLEDFASSAPSAEGAAQLLIRTLNREATHLDEVSDLDDLHFHNLIQEKIRASEIRDAYYLLRILEGDLLFLKKVRSLRAEEADYLHSVQIALGHLQKVKHQGAEAYTIVDTFMHGLNGPITKNLIRKKYGNDFNTLGTAANLKLAQDLQTNDPKNKMLRTFIGLSRISDYTKLLLKKANRPEYKTLYLGKKTKVKEKQAMWVEMSEISELLRASSLPARPLDELMMSCVNGGLYYKGYRRPTKSTYPTGRGKEIITLVLVDESGSMRGERSQLTQAMLAAFMDRARGESSKKVQHNVVVIPFAEKVLPSTTIASNEGAEEYLDKVIEGKTIHGGGTDIEGALIAAYGDIAKSFNGKSKVDLRQANIWLLTDGESVIDEKKLAIARDQIPEDVEVNLNVLFIGQRNENLEKFLKEKSGESLKVMKFVSSEKINTLLAPTVERTEDVFATNANQLQLEGLSELQALKGTGLALSTTASARSHSCSSFLEDQELLSLKKLLNFDRDPKRQRDIELELIFKDLKKHKEQLKAEGRFSLLMVKLLKHLASTGTISKLNVLNYQQALELL